MIWWLLQFGRGVCCGEWSSEGAGTPTLNERCLEYYLLSPERTTLMGTNIRNKIDVNFELEMHPIGVGKENYERLQI